MFDNLASGHGLKQPLQSFSIRLPVADRDTLLFEGALVDGDNEHVRHQELS